jgi:hypothetical protein
MEMKEFKDIEAVLKGMENHLDSLNGVYRDCRLPCCGYDLSNLEKGKRGPVMWNPEKKRVQCHACGKVWVPSMMG